MSVTWGRPATDLSQADRAAADGFDFLQGAPDLVPGLDDSGMVRRRERLRGGA